LQVERCLMCMRDIDARKLIIKALKSRGIFYKHMATYRTEILSEIARKYSVKWSPKSQEPKGEVKMGRRQQHTAYINQKFGFWTVVGNPIYYGASDGYKALCRCRCGKTRSVTVRHLTTGKSFSCGCARVLYSLSAMQRLERIYNKLPANHGWRNYQAFQVWAISAGYHNKAKLRLIIEGMPYGPYNCSWDPPRKRPLK